MRNKKEIGNWGENLAKNFLIERQYSILASNWSFNNTEIDIICRKNNIIIFVEVKTRKSIQFGLPVWKESKSEPAPPQKVSPVEMEDFPEDSAVVAKIELNEQLCVILFNGISKQAYRSSALSSN
jgi:hypothetical protein